VLDDFKSGGERSVEALLAWAVYSLFTCVGMGTVHASSQVSDWREVLFSRDVASMVGVKNQASAHPVALSGLPHRLHRSVLP
jgi:hypothetical protein